jgi:Fe-S-cluster-containing hydrogenase component 2
MSVPTVRLAQQRGVGPVRLEDVRIDGEQVPPLVMEDFEKTLTASLSRAPPVLINTLKRFTAVKPIINVSNCRRRGECYRACPPKAITFKKARGPDIDYSKCIRCYCCQELCPEGAITVSAPLVRRILKR